LERQKSKSEKENVVALLTVNWMSENFLLKKFAFESEHFAINLFDPKWSNFSDYRLLQSLHYFELWLIVQ
jgi:hypothetical protein